MRVNKQLNSHARYHLVLITAAILVFQNTTTAKESPTQQTTESLDAQNKSAVLTVVNKLWEKAKSTNPVRFEEHTTSTLPTIHSAEKKVEQSVKTSGYTVWIEGRSIRCEGTDLFKKPFLGIGQVDILFEPNGVSNWYEYDAQHHSYIKGWPGEPWHSNFVQRCPGFVSLNYYSQLKLEVSSGRISSTLEILGTKRINGKEATVVEHTERSVGGKEKFSVDKWYIWTETGLPLRREIEMRGFQKSIMEWAGFVFDDIANSLFEVPKELVFDASAFVDALNEAPNEANLASHIKQRIGEGQALMALSYVEDLIMPAFPSDDFRTRAMTVVPSRKTELGGEHLDEGLLKRALMFVDAIDPDRGLRLARQILNPRRYFLPTISQWAANVIQQRGGQEVTVKEIIQAVEDFKRSDVEIPGRDLKSAQAGFEGRATTSLVLLDTPESTQWLDGLVKKSVGLPTFSLERTSEWRAALTELVRRNPTVYRPLLTRLLTSHNPEERSAAIKASTALHDDEQLPNLLRQLEAAESSRERPLIIEALGQLGDRRAVDPLIKILVGKSSADAKWAAIESLGQLKDHRATQPLIDALDVEGFFKKEKEKEKTALPFDVTTFNKDHFMKKEMAATTKPFNADRFFRTSFMTAILIVQALGEIGDQEAVPILK